MALPGVREFLGGVVCLLARTEDLENLFEPVGKLKFLALPGEADEALLGSLASEKPRSFFSWPSL